MSEIKMTGFKFKAVLAILILMAIITNTILFTPTAYATSVPDVKLEVYSVDEAYDESNNLEPRIYIRNIGTETIHNFDMYYYFTAEDGIPPVLDEYFTEGAEVSLVKRENNDYAVKFHFENVDFKPGEKLPYTKEGYVVGIHTPDWTDIIKSNDYSNPVETTIAPNHNICVFGIAPDVAGEVLYYGNNPTESKDSVVAFRNFEQSQYSNGCFMETVSASQTLKLGVGKYLSNSTLGHFQKIDNSDGTVSFVHDGKLLVADTSDNSVHMADPQNTGDLAITKWSLEETPDGNYYYVKCSNNKYKLNLNRTNMSFEIIDQSVDTPSAKWDLVNIDDNILFEDTFKDKYSSFLWHSFEGEIGATPGLVVTEKNDYTTTVNSDASTDYFIEADITVKSGSAGIAFRRKAGNWDEKYLWNLNTQNGKTEAFYHCYYKDPTISLLSSKDANIEPNKKYHIKIVVKGTVFSLYIDGVLIDSVEDTNIETGQIGYRVSDSSEAIFHHVIVTKEELGTTDPTPTPTSTPFTPSTPTNTPRPTPSEKPSKPVLSHDNFDKDGNYTVMMDMWEGVNGTSWELYENDVKIFSEDLEDNTPGRQNSSFDVSGKSPGRYIYKATLINSIGSTTSSPLIVDVEGTSTGSKPGTPVLTYTLTGNGSYDVIMNMAGGTNGTSWRLYENGFLVESKPLQDSSPAPQSDTCSFNSRAPGTYTYTAILSNEFGESKSVQITVAIGNYPQPTPVSPPSFTPLATGKPGAFSLSHDNNDYDGNYNIFINMPSGNNGTTWKLYENGHLIYTGRLTDFSPNPQSSSFYVKKRANGTYIYSVELINNHGTTTGNSLYVPVYNSGTSDGTIWNTNLGNGEHEGNDSSESGKFTTGSGFDLLTGSYNEENKDLEIGGNGLDFALLRTYNSMSNKEKTVVGNGFRTNYDSTINILEDGSADVTYPSGTKVHFFKKNGLFSAPKSTTRDKLEKVGDQYHLLRMDDLSYLIFEGGKLITIKDRYNNINTITYSNDRYVQVKDQLGRYINFEYDGKGMLKRAYDISGRSVTYAYDNNGNLTTFTDANGNPMTYRYDSQNRINEIVDQNGNITSKMVYDDQNRMTSQSDGEGNTKTFTYNNGERIIRSNRKALNNNGTFYNVPTSSSITFNINYKSLKEVDDAGNTTTHNYYYTTGSGNWIDITNPQKDSQGQKDYESARDDNRITGTREVITDKNGYKTTKEMNGEFLPTIETDHTGLTTTTTYDQWGNILSQKDRSGATTTYTYSGDGRKVIRERDPIGNYKTYEYYGNVGSYPIEQGIYVNGLIKNINYYKLSDQSNPGSSSILFKKVYQLYNDNLNNRTNVITYYGNSSDPYSEIYEKSDLLGRIISNTDERYCVHKYSYNNLGKMLSDYSYSPSGVVLKASNYKYDKVGNLTEETDQKFAPGSYAYGEKLTSVHTYNKNNQLLSSKDPIGNFKYFAYDPQGRVIEEKDEKDAITRYEFDGIGRETKKIDPENKITTTQYTRTYAQNNTYTDTKRVTEPSGKVIITESDSYGRAVKNTIQYYSNGNLKNLVTTYAYGTAGRLIRYTDHNNYVKTYSYDMAGRPLWEVSGLGLTDSNGNSLQTTKNIKYTCENSGAEAFEKITVTTSYGTKTFTTSKVLDPGGHTVKETDPLNGVTSYAYNRAGDMIEVTNAKGMKTYNTYDYLGNTTKTVDALGRTYTFSYDSMGNKIHEKDEIGAINSFIYDKLNRVTAKIDHFENQTTYNYSIEVDTNTNQKVYKESSVNLLGSISTITFDKMNRKIAETTSYLENGVRVEKKATFSYDNLGNLKETIDTKGKKTSYSYDSLGRITSIYDGIDVKDKTGKSLTIRRDYEYNTVDENGRRFNITLEKDYRDNNLIKTTQTKSDALEHIVEEKVSYSVNGINKVETTTRVFDPQGNIIKATNTFNKSITFEYDVLNRMTKSTDPNGNTEESYYDSLGNKIKYVDKRKAITLYEYDALNRVVKITDPLGNATTTTYSMIISSEGRKNRVIVKDPLGRESMTQYDLFSRPEKEVRSFHSGSTNLNLINTKSYTGSGDYVYMKDQSGKASEMFYDELGRVIKVVDGIDLEDENGNSLERTDTTQYLTYTEGSSQLSMKTETDYLGNTKSIVVDVFGRPYIEIDSAGNKITYEYDSAGNLVSKTDQDNKVWKYEYDPCGRVIKETDPLGKSNYMHYDELGRNTVRIDKRGNRTEYTYDDMDRLISIKDPYGDTITYTYDAMGNQTSMKDKKGNEVKYEYDLLNRVISDSDQLGNSCYYGYDAVGRKIWQSDRKNHAATEPGVVSISTSTGTQYRLLKHSVYDPMDRIISVTDEASNTAFYSYDIMGNIISQTDPSGRKTHYKYDALGRMIQKTDPTGYSEFYTYDIGNRVISKTDRIGNVFNYTYDNMDRKTSETCGSQTTSLTYTKLGLIKTITDGNGTISYDYDIWGKVTKKTFPDGKTIDYRYDEEGNRIYMKDPYGSETTYKYDNLNRMTEVATSGSITTYLYDKNGNRNVTILPNGSKSTYEYDQRNLCTKVTNEYGGSRSIYTYTYDANYLQISKTEPSGKTDFQYDNGGRIVKITEPGGRVTTYTYDNSGNRLTQSVQSSDVYSLIEYTYNLGNRLVKTVETKNNKVTTTDIAYDNNGNQKNVVVTSPEGVTTSLFSSYDVYNRMVETDTPQGKLSAKYDMFGMRTQKTINGVTTKYYYDGVNPVIEVKQDQVIRNTFGINLISRKDSTSTLYYLYNGNSDVVTVTDQAGVVSNSYEYDVFGNPVVQNEKVENPYRFKGYYYDKETSLYYLNSRYYDPSNARFTTEDTIAGSYQDPLSLNLYTYCVNNPVSFSDPSGHWFGSKIYKAAKRAVSSVVDAVVDTVVDGANAVWEGTKDVASFAWNGVKEVASFGYKAYSLVLTFGQSTDILGDGWKILKKVGSFAYDIIKDNWDTILCIAIGALLGGNPIIMAALLATMKAVLSDIKEGSFSFDKIGKYAMCGIKGGIIEAVNVYTGGTAGSVLGILEKTAVGAVAGGVTEAGMGLATGKFSWKNTFKEATAGAISGAAKGIQAELKVGETKNLFGQVTSKRPVYGVLSSMSGSALGISSGAWVSIGASVANTGLTEFSNQMYDNNGKLNGDSWKSIIGKTIATSMKSTIDAYIQEPDNKRYFISNKGDVYKNGYVGAGGALYRLNKNAKDWYFTLKAAEKVVVHFSANFVQNYAFGTAKQRSDYWKITTDDGKMGGLIQDLGTTGSAASKELKNAALESAPKLQKLYHDGIPLINKQNPVYQVYNYLVIKPFSYISEPVSTYGLRYANDYVVKPVLIPAAKFSLGVAIETPIIGLGVKYVINNSAKWERDARKGINEFLTLPEVP